MVDARFAVDDDAVAYFCPGAYEGSGRHEDALTQFRGWIDKGRRMDDCLGREAQFPGFMKKREAGFVGADGGVDLVRLPL